VPPGPQHAPAPMLHLFEHSAAAPRPQHHHESTSRSPPPSAARCAIDCGKLDPGAVIRPVAANGHPRMPQQTRGERSRADWAPAATRSISSRPDIGARLEVADRHKPKHKARGEYERVSCGSARAGDVFCEWQSSIDNRLRPSALVRLECYSIRRDCMPPRSILILKY